MKLFPDSSETENPQASGSADCQGRGFLPLVSALCRPLLSIAQADAEGGQASHPEQLPSSFPATQLVGGQAGRFPRPGMGFTVSLMLIAGLILNR